MARPDSSSSQSQQPQHWALAPTRLFAPLALHRSLFLRRRDRSAFRLGCGRRAALFTGPSTSTEVRIHAPGPTRAGGLCRSEKTVRAGSVVVCAPARQGEMPAWLQCSPRSSCTSTRPSFPFSMVSQQPVEDSQEVRLDWRPPTLQDALRVGGQASVEWGTRRAKPLQRGHHWSGRPWPGDRFRPPVRHPAGGRLSLFSSVTCRRSDAPSGTLNQGFAHRGWCGTGAGRRTCAWVDMSRIPRCA